LARTLCDKRSKKGWKVLGAALKNCMTFVLICHNKKLNYLLASPGVKKA